MKDKTTTAAADTKVGLAEFFKISWWSLRFVFKLQPFYTSVRLFTSSAIRLVPIANTLLFAKSIDALTQGIKTSAGLEIMYPYLAASIGLNVAGTILDFTNSFVMTALRNNTQPKIRQALYTKVYELGIQTLEQPEIQNQLHRANDYLSQVLSYFSDVILAISGIVRLITVLIAVAAFLPLFVPIIILITIPYYLNDRHFRGKIYGFSFSNTEGTRKAGAAASDLTLMKSLQEIYITGAFKFFSDKYQNFMTWYNDERMSIYKPWRIGNYSLGFLVDTAVLGGVVIIFKNVLQGLISIGTVTFQAGMLSSFRAAVADTMVSFNDLFEYSIQLKDVYRLFNTEPLVKDGQKSLSLPSGPEIIFENVSFKYPNTDKFIYKNLNLEIKSGEKIALVGPNGVGKTTLVKLLCRFYNVTEGRILINGYDLNDLKIDAFYKNLGVFFQDFETYPQLTVKENIIVGDPSRKVIWSEVLDAAKKADALDFIQQYKDGFDQVLSEQYKGGIRPSTGQWQKLVMARFFYRDSPLVIFDEPTSAIDAVSEAKIFDKIYDSFKGKTVIIVSHRFSTVRNADRIIVLKNGKIVEEGNHKHLLALDGEYARSYNLQAKGYSDNGD